MRDKTEIIDEFQRVRALVIAESNSSEFRKGWLQALGWALDGDAT